MSSKASIQAMEYYKKNRTDILPKRREWWAKNAERLNKERREKRQNDPQWRFKQIQKSKLSYQKNREKYLEYNKLHKNEKNKQQRELARKIRLQILNHYSNGDIKCACCGERELEFLSIDHINNDGYKHRRIHGFGRGFYSWIIRNGYPPTFQILCMNCNFAKGKIGICPHMKTTITVLEAV